MTIKHKKEGPTPNEPRELQVFAKRGEYNTTTHNYQFIFHQYNNYKTTRRQAFACVKNYRKP